MYIYIYKLYIYIYSIVYIYIYIKTIYIYIYIYNTGGRPTQPCCRTPRCRSFFSLPGIGIAKLRVTPV